MKVALLGAPGAGKTEIAKRLVRNLNQDKTKHHWVAIDGYVEQLTKRTGLKYGMNAYYPHNAQVMTERWNREAEALWKDHSTITCGAIYETIIYAACLDLDFPAEEQAIMEQQYRASVCNQFFGLMEQMTFNYDVLFYLPNPEIEEEHSWAAVVNAKLPDVLQAFFRYYVILEAGKPREKVKHALEVIRFIRDTYDSSQEEPASDQQPAVS